MMPWGDVWWPATVLLFGPRWLLAAPALALLPAAWWTRSRTAWLVLLALLLVAGPVMGLVVPLQRARPTAGLRVTVFTCNVHYRQPNLDKLRALLDETRPTIVALQEWPDPGPVDLFDDKEWSIHRAPHLFLASRLPIREVYPVSPGFMSKNGAALRYDLATDAGLVHFFNLHFASPRQGLYLTVHDTAKGMITVEAGSKLRWQQSETVARAAEALTGPVLLAGDFNTPPESAIFRGPWHGYTDAFAAAGWGWGYTFKGGKTLVRIDHILAGPGWHCERCWVGPNLGPPHRPVVAELIWPKDR